MKRILITHTDLDGAGCAILFRRKYPDIEIQFHDYDTIDEVSEILWNTRDEYDSIYFADITPNEEYGRKMTDNQKFTLIDHHITREYLKIPSTHNGRIIYGTSHCATFLTAKYFDEDIMYIDRYRSFILAVDAYDTWKLDSSYRKRGINLNLLFNYYRMEKFINRFADMYYLSDKECVILEVLQKIERDYLAEKLKQGTIRTDKDGNTYFEVYTAEKGGHLGVLVDDPDFPDECEYIKVINLNDLVVGLYSKDFDVSGIAELHGGGGHRCAAGYQLESIHVTMCT